MNRLLIASVSATLFIVPLCASENPFDLDRNIKKIENNQNRLLQELSRQKISKTKGAPVKKREAGKEQNSKTDSSKVHTKKEPDRVGQIHQKIVVQKPQKKQKEHLSTDTKKTQANSPKIPKTIAANKKEKKKNKSQQNRVVSAPKIKTKKQQTHKEAAKPSTTKKETQRTKHIKQMTKKEKDPKAEVLRAAIAKAVKQVKANTHLSTTSNTLKKETKPTTNNTNIPKNVLDKEKNKTEIDLAKERHEKERRIEEELRKAIREVE